MDIGEYLQKSGLQSSSTTAGLHIVNQKTASAQIVRWRLGHPVCRQSTRRGGGRGDVQKYNHSLALGGNWTNEE